MLIISYVCVRLVRYDWAKYLRCFNSIENYNTLILYSFYMEIFN